MGLGCEGGQSSAGAPGHTRPDCGPKDVGQKRLCSGGRRGKLSKGPGSREGPLHPVPGHRLHEPGGRW